MKDINLAKSRNFLLKESVGLSENDYDNGDENKSPEYMQGYGDGYTDGFHDGENGNEKAVDLNEMAKIQGELKSAIEKVITDNPELNGLPLKKVIRKDQAVLDALDGDDLYDNQLNKFIAAAKGERVVGQRGRKSGGTAAKDDISDEPSSLSQTSLMKLVSEPGASAPNVWGDEEVDDEVGGFDNSLDNEDDTDANGANFWKNIIVKKVGKLEALPLKDRGTNPDMYSLKQIIQKPEVKKALGVDTIRSLVSPIMG